MATLVLGAVGAAVGGSLGGSFLGLSGAVIGRAAGAALGRVVDQTIMGGGSDAIETGRIDRLRLTGASEGAVLPRVVGRVRIGGQVIWATRFKEHRSSSSGGGKGGPKAPKQTSFSYSISLAVALCEGEITRVGRIWADGREIARDDIQMRVYKGDDTQLPDALIEAHEGAGHAPAFRGTAYVVIEDLDISPYGNRVPNLSFEVLRAARAEGEVPAPSELIEGVALVPGTGEFALATTSVHYDHGNGAKESANINTPQRVSDFRVAMRDLTEEFPKLKSTSLIVSWFGTDLRCGACRLHPRVEHKAAEGKPQRWRVAGLDRDAAGQVPLKDGRPVYGGTPSDASVVEAIRDLNARDIDVTFYPFILMEQMAGNGLPDPWGNAEQAALPWRGRITSELAPGRDGTTDGSAAAEAEVARFFGEVPGGEDSDWNYRRFILHYASLCAEAGGVEAFCIGSEMRSLTRVRGPGNTFPAVAALQRLARDVRAILPDAKIGYAADWSEYFGYHPADTGNLHYHLDPLWADPSIDFIGIDNYMPLGDWRDGRDHADAAFGSIKDLDYLQSNIEGGEGFDWYYPTPEARAAQRRLPIRDGAHGEDWVWRFKDLRNWWSEPHHDRIDGERRTMPTAWIPMSKPIRFTEYGCAAIDKGANQPNKFIDAKSSESALPRHSNGRRDDTMQIQYLRAFVDYWGDARRNPQSPKFDGRMIDMAHSLAWAWDTRPWPYFPELGDYWSDGVNHARGHWLTGRSATQPLSTAIAEICRASGLERFDVSKVRGSVRGYSVAEVQSARADLQPLLLAHGVEASERSGRIVFSMRDEAREVELTAERMVRGDGDVLRYARGPEAETTRRVVVHHIDAAGDFETRVAEAVLHGTETLPVSETELPLSLTRGEAQAVAERFLSETHVSRDSVEFALAPSRRDVVAGDLLRLAGHEDLWRVDRIEDGADRRVKAVRTERGLYEPSDEAEDGTGRLRPFAPLPVDSVILDLPALSVERTAHAPYVAVAARPWPGTVAVHMAVDDSDYELNLLVEEPSQIGITRSVLEPAAPSVWDNGPELLIEMGDGSLSSVSDRSMLAGANAMAIGSGEPAGWEVVQFRHARPVGAGLWSVSRRLRGQRGTEHLAGRTWPIGSRVVILDRSVRQMDLPLETLGQDRHLRIGPASLPLGHEAFEHRVVTAEGNGLRPFSPVHLRTSQEGDHVQVRWIRRSRTGTDGWNAHDVPLGEREERYLVQLETEAGEILREETVAEPAFAFDAAALRTSIGETEPIVIRVAQMSDEVGVGQFASITLV
ncbi:glycoside hydrolase/phage tail family protein [Jannaschia sp. S6380]|uniref:baseplate multidomain protein megatron n=1 Tax=Jannaschia sp. S6380 TaxID=2926408 RepID=UPI001FF43266|nr:glycoside hydrolase TIM-barrel-like domain-containing protein [Jannaschia sp. S6380]MCK0166883.1 glycoside hydrolase/phage tail family protein [Jannaschia sp. S6380]